VSDAVVIGSRIIQEIEAHDSSLGGAKLISSVENFILSIRLTMDQPS
jgi:tryptophan synthase alpha subunit